MVAADVEELPCDVFAPETSVKEAEEQASALPALTRTLATDFSQYEFDLETGKLVRSFSTPANLLPRTENGTLWYASNDDPETLTGRQSNRGYEGASTNALRWQCMLAEREQDSVS
jgi:hypothetical protein